MSNNDKKFKLLLGMIIAIIVVLLGGIIYQFIFIKKLENKIDNLNKNQTAIIKIYDENF